MPNHRIVRFGSRNDDVLLGETGRDALFGRSGDDVLDGRTGDDILFGGFGSDVLDGGEGSDRLFGGLGNDRLVYTSGGGARDLDRYDGGRGFDTLSLELTLEDWASAAFQSELQSFVAQLATGPTQGHGGFTFASLGLHVRRIEALEVSVDGVALNPLDEEVVAVDDAATVDEDRSAPLVGNVLGNDAVPDLASDLAILSGPVFGSFDLAADGSYSYTLDNAAVQSLAAGETRVDLVTYRVTDVDGDSDTATLEITVEGRNDDPTASDVTATVGEDGPGTLIAGSFGDVDASDVLSIGIDTTGTLGTVTDNGDGTFFYDPAGRFEALVEGETAIDSFTYTVDDGNGGTATARVDVTIEGAEDAAPRLLDIATAKNASGGGIGGTVALNGGAGTFVTQDIGGQGGGRGDVAIGDFDGDGFNDLYFARSFSPDLVYLNDGAGNFIDSGQALGTSGAFKAEVGDLDGDGALDVVVANNGPGVVLWSNDGTGNFSDTLLQFSFRVRDVGLGDLDGDGDLDVVSAITQGFINGGPVGFGGLSFITNEGAFFSVADDPGTDNRDMVAAEVFDIDADGDLDVVGVAIGGGNRGPQAHAILLNDGTGAFTDTGQLFDAGNSQDAAVGDFDGNGFEDVVITDGTDTLQVLLNDGDGTFTEQALFVGGRAFSVDLGDLDGNGSVEIVVGDRLGGSVGVFEYSDGAAAEAARFAAGGPFGVAIGELDAALPVDDLAVI